MTICEILGLIKLVEGYLGFCSINSVLGHFHGVCHELYMLHMYWLLTKTIFYNIRSSHNTVFTQVHTVFTQSDILWLIIEIVLFH